MDKVESSIAMLEKAGFALIFASRPDISLNDEWGRPNNPQIPEVRLDLDDLVLFPIPVLPVIFLHQHILTESHFQHTTHRLGEETVTIDLLRIEPKLKHFQQYLFESTEVEFFAPYNGLLLTCHICEDWYKEFLDLQRLAEAQAREQLAHEVQAHRELQAAQVQAELRPHEQRIRLLLDDNGFLKLIRAKSTTQRTLFNYIKLQEPQAIQVLGEMRVKELISELKDWVILYPEEPLKAWVIYSRSQQINDAE